MQHISFKIKAESIATFGTNGLKKGFCDKGKVLMPHVE